MRLVDTHSHIHDREFDADRAATIERARAAGVEAIVALGVTAANSQHAVDLAEQHHDVFAAVGVHPHDAKDATDADLAALEELARHPRVVMVGEIGLDFYRDLSPRDVQTRVFRRQLQTATHVSKPVAVHARDAHSSMFPLIEEWSRETHGRLPDGRPLGVMHYFSEDAALARRYTQLGFMISIHTSVTHPKATQLVDVARQMPLGHLVLETDSPYGAPQSHRGKRNEPARVAEAAAKVAEIKGVQIEEVGETTTANALALFGVEIAACAGARKDHR
jgi:TatD DNase family protein